MATTHDGITDDELVRLFDRLPDGFAEVTFARHRWGLVGARHADGAIRSFTAHRLADSRVVGANLYLASSGARLRPCEVDPAHVLAFLVGFRVVAPREDPWRPPVPAVGLGERLRTRWLARSLRRRGLLSAGP